VHAYRQAALLNVVGDIAWRAQRRLPGRVRRLVARGKAQPKVATAIARELTGFIWAIAREVTPTASSRGDRQEVIGLLGGTVVRWRTLEGVRGGSVGGDVRA
jgi:hypothetical protein